MVNLCHPSFQILLIAFFGPIEFTTLGAGPFFTFRGVRFFTNDGPFVFLPKMKDNPGCEQYLVLLRRPRFCCSYMVQEIPFPFLDRRMPSGTSVSNGVQKVRKRGCCSSLPRRSPPPSPVFSSIGSPGFSPYLFRGRRVLLLQSKERVQNISGSLRRTRLSLVPF